MYAALHDLEHQDSRSMAVLQPPAVLPALPCIQTSVLRSYRVMSCALCAWHVQLRSTKSLRGAKPRAVIRRRILFAAVARQGRNRQFHWRIGLSELASLGSSFSTALRTPAPVRARRLDCAHDHWHAFPALEVGARNVRRQRVDRRWHGWHSSRSPAALRAQAAWLKFLGVLRCTGDGHGTNESHAWFALNVASLYTGLPLEMLCKRKQSKIHGCDTERFTLCQVLPQCTCSPRLAHKFKRIERRPKH